MLLKNNTGVAYTRDYTANAPCCTERQPEPIANGELAAGMSDNEGFFPALTFQCSHQIQLPSIEHRLSNAPSGSVPQLSGTISAFTFLKLVQNLKEPSGGFPTKIQGEFHGLELGFARPFSTKYSTSCCIVFN